MPCGFSPNPGLVLTSPPGGVGYNAADLIDKGVIVLTSPPGGVGYNGKRINPTNNLVLTSPPGGVGYNLIGTGQNARRFDFTPRRSRLQSRFRMSTRLMGFDFTPRRSRLQFDVDKVCVLPGF